MVSYVSTANVITNLFIVKASTFIYGNQEAKVKDTLIIYAAKVGWFEPVGERHHEKDDSHDSDTKNFERHMSLMIKHEIYYNHLILCTGSSSRLLSNFIEKLLQGAVYFLPVFPCLSSNPLENLLDTGNLILHPYHVDFITKREALPLQWAFVISVFTRAWVLWQLCWLCCGFSWMRMDALLDGFTIKGNAAT